MRQAVFEFNHDPGTGELLSAVDASIARLAKKKFKCDPLIASKFSRIASVVSSAYKRHGILLERSLVVILQSAPHLTVWTDAKFLVSSEALMLADQDLHGNGAGLPYGGTKSVRQIDLLVHNQVTGLVGAYDSKRGFGHHDAGKKRSMLRDLRCTEILLRSYAKGRGIDATGVTARIISHLGRRSLPRRWVLTTEELDEHFGVGWTMAIEAMNNRFRCGMDALLRQLDGEG